MHKIAVQNVARVAIARQNTVTVNKLQRDVGEFQAPDRPIDPAVFAHFKRQ